MSKIEYLVDEDCYLSFEPTKKQVIVVYNDGKRLTWPEPVETLADVLKIRDALVINSDELDGD
jgi:hypothetical protein